MRYIGRRRDDARFGESAVPDVPADVVTPHPQAIAADDALIDAVRAGKSPEPSGWPGGTDPDERLVAMLSAWRADAQAGHELPLVSVDRAVAVLARARLRRRLVPLASAAALLVFACSGLAIAAGSAQPDDPLWGLSQVIDSDRADSVAVAVDVRTRLAAVRTALRAGHTDVAASELAKIGADLPAVRTEEGRTELAAEQQFLAAKLAQTPAGVPTDPDAPPGSTTPAGSPPVIAAPPNAVPQPSTAATPPSAAAAPNAPAGPPPPPPPPASPTPPPPAPPPAPPAGGTPAPPPPSDQGQPAPRQRAGDVAPTADSPSSSDGGSPATAPQPPAAPDDPPTLEVDLGIVAVAMDLT